MPNLRTYKMKKLYKDLIRENYVFCLPKEVKIDMQLVGAYRCNLKVPCNEILLKAVCAEGFLKKGYNATDANGTLLTLLDSNLEKYLVVIEDLNLYFALREDAYLDDNNVWVEILSDLPKSRRYSF